MEAIQRMELFFKKLFQFNSVSIDFLLWKLDLHNSILFFTSPILCFFTSFTMLQVYKSNVLTCNHNLHTGFLWFLYWIVFAAHQNFLFFILAVFIFKWFFQRGAHGCSVLCVLPICFLYSYCSFARYDIIR